VKRVVLLLLFAALIAPVEVAAKDRDPAAAEAKLKPDVVRLLVDYAAWCAQHGAKTEGGNAVAEATALDPQAARRAETKSALDALSADAADAAETVAAERKTVGPKIAAAYDRLAAIDHDAKDAVRFEDYVSRALDWDASSARIAKARKLVADALGANRGEEAGRLLVRLERADEDGVAAGKYEKIEVEIASKDALLVGSAGHPLVGYVSLPRDWTKGKRWPVLVAVDGAGCGFLGSCKSFAATRGSRPFIVVAPMTLSNTNELPCEKYPSYPKTLLDAWNGKRLGFDGPGVDALLGVVAKRFGGEDEVFLTGFSGGGIYAYWKLFQDPAHVRGAAPACANFGGAGLEGAPGVTNGGPPVLLLTGEKDPYRDEVFGQKPGIEGQTDLAEENLKRLGYRHVSRTRVPGAGHNALPEHVWKFVDQVTGAK
jgi:hypothetical protein